MSETREPGGFVSPEWPALPSAEQQTRQHRDSMVQWMRDANAALPDGDPRKLTHDDAFYLGEVLANFAAWAETDAGEFLRPGFREYAAHARAAIAKIEALLPPAPAVLPPQDPADAADRLGRRMGV